MAFFALLWKARTIEKYRLNYEREKINSIVMGNTQIEKTFGQKWRHYRYDTQKRISKSFKKWYPVGSGVSNFLLYLRTDQTFPNFLLKSVVGFVGGVILTYLFFMFFVFQLSISLVHATIMSSTIGVLLTLGLAFSYRIRCLVFLLIPQLFSRVGRYTLTCYALVLILTGPATNTLKNSEVLSESLACGQEQIKLSVHELNESMKKPFHAMKDSFKLMMERFQLITKGVKEAVLKINRLILSIVTVIHSSFGWLKSVAEICNTKLGTPYERCKDQLKAGVADCRDALGPDYNWLCNVAYVAHVACVAVKPHKTFCSTIDDMDEAVVATIKKKLRNFTEHMRAMFRLEVHIQRSHSFGNGNRSTGQVAAGIMTEIRNRADPLITWLSWSSCVTSLFLVLIIFRAKYYQHMYETRSRFDNRYITRDVRELDLKRQRQGRETILPLNRRERAKYITTTSFRLLASEKVNMYRYVVFMTITTFKLLIHMIADYSLYWVLITIRHHGRLQSNLLPGVPQTGVHVTGNGFVTRLFRSIVDTLDIPLASPSPSPVPCLPDPYPPDLGRYAQIGVLIFLLWFFALFEPYGLRLRHIVMGQYRPERAKARASWLYNHILRTRASFMKFARRKLHREYKYCSESHLTFRQWVYDRIPFQRLRELLRICPPESHCLLCGIHRSENNDDTKLIRCKTPKCPGVYCACCFSDIGQLCTICLSPADYGDLSDVSLERGSSDESSDSEAEPENVRQPDANDRPFLWMRVSKDDNSNELAKLKERIKGTSNKGVCDKENKMEAKDIANLLQGVDENNNYIDIYKAYHGYNEQIKENKELVKICHNIHTSKYNNDLKLDKINVSLIAIHLKHSRRSIKLRHYTNKRLLRKLHQYCNSAKTLHQNLKIRKSKKKYKNININKKVKRIKTFVCHFASNTDTCKVRKHSGCKETSVPEKDKNKQISKLTNQNNPTKRNKTANIPTTFPDDKPKKAKSNLRFVRSKTSREKIGEFHSFFSKHWKNIKFSLIPCVSREINTDNIQVKENKNYKHRKKRKCTKLMESKSKIKIVKKDIRNARNYRISTFLADWDWAKRDYNNKNKNRESSLIETDWLTKSNNPNPNKIITVARVGSPPANWYTTTKYRLCPCSDLNTSCPRPEPSPSLKASTPLTKQKEFALKALKRFRNKVKLLCSSSNILEAKADIVNVATGISFINNEEKSEHIVRRMNSCNSLIKVNIELDKKRIKADSLPKDEFREKDSSLRVYNSTPYILKDPPKNIHDHTADTCHCKNVDNSTRTNNNRDIAVSKSGVSFCKNKSTYVFKKRRSKATQDQKIIIDQDTQKPSSEMIDIQKTNEDLKQSKTVLSLVRDFYSSIFGSSCKQVKDTGNTAVKVEDCHVKELTAEKSVIAEPEMIVASCQYQRCNFRDMATQVFNEENVTSLNLCIYDKAVSETRANTCTCATQHILKYRNIGMNCRHHVCKRLRDAAVQYQRKVSSKNLHDKKSHDFITTINTSSTTSSPTSSSTKSDETKTDTTVCSLATVEYKEPSRRIKKNKVVTKANQSTLTEKTRCHDISTYTEDWWSPILERKQKKQMIPHQYTVVDKHRHHEKYRKNQGVETDGKYVSFKSRTQVIPIHDDVLSPSRYLLESQRYYNELFSYKFAPPQVYSVKQEPRCPDKTRSPLGSRRCHHRKTKRLEECYSPRRQKII